MTMYGTASPRDLLSRTGDLEAKATTRDGGFGSAGRYFKVFAQTVSVYLQIQENLPKTLKRDMTGTTQILNLGWD